MVASAISRAARAARAVANRTQRRRGRYLRWLPPQQQFLASPARRKLLRSGNQWLGKSTVGLYDVDCHCRGEHPFIEVKPPPVEWWIVCATWQQSVAIQKKFWEVCDRDALDERTEFDEARGFRGKNPVVRYKNGSILRFKTGKQGGRALASDTVDGVLIDEPIESRIYEELNKRVSRRGGKILLTLTPINGPTDWLRELCEQGAIEDHHFRLKPEHLIPVGASRPLRAPDGRLMDGAWCAEFRADTVARERPVTVDGEWEVRAEGQVFDLFDARLVSQGGMVVPRGEVPPVDFTLAIGADHGAKDFKEVITLVGLDFTTGDRYPWLYVLGEYVAEGDSLPADDARGAVGLLDSWGWQWADLNAAYGDKPYDAGYSGNRPIGRKSNRELQAEIAKLTGKRGHREVRPAIWQAKTGAGGGRGSIDRGCEWLHRIMVRGRFRVVADCTRTIEALEKWDYTDSDFKDPVDALRYATWKWAMRGERRAREGREASVYVY